MDRIFQNETLTSDRKDSPASKKHVSSEPKKQHKKPAVKAQIRPPPLANKRPGNKETPPPVAAEQAPLSDQQGASAEIPPAPQLFGMNFMLGSETWMPRTSLESMNVTQEVLRFPANPVMAMPSLNTSTFNESMANMRRHNLEKYITFN